jgi:hypothetical protein
VVDVLLATGDSEKQVSVSPLRKLTINAESKRVPRALPLQEVPHGSATKKKTDRYLGFLKLIGVAPRHEASQRE